MNVLNLTQNTPEWEEFRRMHIGASDCPIILGKSPFKNARQLWDEKVLNKKSYTSSAMKRGSSLEEEARAHAELYFNISLKPVVIQSDQREWQIASLDGASDDVIVEIKCPGLETFEKIQRGDRPEYFEWQGQHQMSVDLKRPVVFFIYYPDRNPIVWEAKWNDLKIDTLIKSEKEFFDSMLNFTPPTPSGRKFEEREDKDWREAVSAYLKAVDAKKTAEEYEAICKESLRYLCKDVPTNGAGLMVYPSYVKGNVDYSKVDALKGIDLESYRKPPIERWNYKTAKPV